MYLVFFTLIGECTLMDLGLLDIKLIIRIVIEEVKKYNVLYEYLSEQFNEKVQNFVPKFEITKCFLTFCVSVCHITKTTKHDGHDDRLHLGNKRKTPFLFVFRSVCTIFATSIYEVLTKNYRMK